MLVNGSTVNTTTLNDDDARSFGMSDYGLAIEKDIVLQNSMTNYGLQVEKSVRALMINYGLAVTKYVRNTAIPDRLTRNGFKSRITLAGSIVPDNMIVGIHTITRGENDAAVMEITLQPPVGIVNLAYYEGRTITYDIIRTSGITRIFTGRVDTPKFDVIDTKRLVLTCSDTRQEQIEAQAATIKNQIGYYAPQNTDTVASVYDEVQERLTSVPYSLDFNASGLMTYTPWAAKASPDFVLSPSQVYRSKPEINFTSRHKLVNQVNIQFQYRYPRLHKKVANYTWTYPFSICEFLIYGHTACTRALVEAAAAGTGWQLMGSVIYTPIFNSGFYYCSSAAFGSGYRTWSTTQAQGATVEKTTVGADGKPVQVKDASGNQEYVGTLTKIVDLTKTLCNGANFKLQKKFAQTITETYTLSVYSAQSQNQYGVVIEQASANVDTNYDTALWESDTKAGPGGTSTYINMEPNLQDFNNTSVAALAQAQTRILAAHRDSFVNFTTPGWESVDLQHTVQVVTDQIKCKGKVRQIVHTIDAEQGDYRTSVELAISRVEGSASANALTPPTRIVDTPATNSIPIQLQTHMGQDPTTAEGLKWNGMIGNATIYTQSAGAGSGALRFDSKNTDYPVQFRVDVPEIAAEDREERQLTASQSYSIVIPNDLLIVEKL